jgi:putative ABC transport system permease protein
VPLYSGAALVKLPDGRHQAVTVLGLDDETLLGRPTLLEGRIEDIYAENGFVAIVDAELPKLGDLHVGSTFELNDHRGVIVGLGRTPTSGLFGIPTLYTTYRRAVEYVPSTRQTTAFILVAPRDAAAVPGIQRQVRALGYEALTRAEFMEKIGDFYTYQTGVGMNIMIMTAVSFLVGLSISAQTFYTFILEHLDRFGALKAMGARGRELVYMILFQAAVTAFLGYGLGVGLATLLIGLAKWRLPSYASILTLPNLALALGMVLVIAGVSSYVGVRRVLRIEPFEVFRG